MLDLRLYMAQRISALAMAPFVVGHLAVMIYAIQGGLSAGEVLSRTQGSIGWALFYGSFVAAVSIHAAVGLRTIAYEWTGLKGAALAIFSWLVFAGLLLAGLRAVYAVTVT